MSQEEPGNKNNKNNNKNNKNNNNKKQNLPTFSHSPARPLNPLLFSSVRNYDIGVGKYP